MSIHCRLARAVALASLTGLAICTTAYLLWLMAPEAAVLSLALWWAALHLEAGWSTPRPARRRRDVPARVVGVRLAGAGVAPPEGCGAAPGSDAHFPRRRTPQVSGRSATVRLHPHTTAAPGRASLAGGAA